MKRNVLLLTLMLAFLLTGCVRNKQKTDIPPEGDLTLPASVALAAETPVPGAVPTNYFLGIPKVPDSLFFAGERVPLDAWYVREALERELTVLCYWHASMTYILQLSTRYFPVLKPLLEAEGVPEDFIYLCVAESSLQQVVSPAGAAGFWQFMKGTGREYGLEINAEVDQRYHIEKATVAAAAYLKKAYALYGSWTMAAASYNMGTNGLTKQIAKQQQHDYYSLHLPAETLRYLFRILAFKLLIPHPEDYGYTLKESDYYKPLESRTVTASGHTDWVEFAAYHQTNYKVLRIFNPWIRDSRVSTGHAYQVKLPVVP